MTTVDRMCLSAAVALAASAFLIASNATAESIVYPGDAGVFNVMSYGAAGDGVADDTAAIQAALNAAVGGIVYLPNGTYKVSDRLEWPDAARNLPLTIRGQSRDGAVIKLQDYAPSYQNPSATRAVVWTNQMGSADNFRNHVLNLTIDTGIGNPGATGLQFMSNNMGAVQDVTIRSGDGAGVTGLDLKYNALNGPLLVKNVSVDGFNVGVASSGTVNSQTIEHLTLTNQHQYGLQNVSQVLSIRGLVSNNAVPAVYNGGAGVMTLIDAALSGSGAQAVQNSAVLFARNVETAGYSQSILNTAGTRQSITGVGHINEYVSHTPLAPSGVNGDARSLNLPIKETPDIPWETDLGKWANVEDFGATGSGTNYNTNDDAVAIQAAIDSGATTIYLPKGSYKLKSQVILRGNVRRIVGMESTITADTKPFTLFKMVDGAGLPAAVAFEQVTFNPSMATNPLDNAASDRALVLQHCKGVGSTHTGTGEIFMDDCGTGVKRPLNLGQTTAYIRQLSNETRDRLTHLSVDGGTAWVLGQKTEQPGTLASVMDGRLEIIGAFAYVGIGGDMPPEPIYNVQDADFSITMGSSHYSTKEKYDLVLHQVLDGLTTDLLPSQVPYNRENFIFLPLLSNLIAQLIPGDANGDGFVDADDLEILVDHWQAAGLFADGDFSGNNFVNVVDLGILASYWQPGPGGIGFEDALARTSLVVPEPAAMALLACAMVSGVAARPRCSPRGI